MNFKQKSFVIFVFLLSFYLFVLFFGLFSSQHYDFVYWAKQNGTDDWWNYPIYKYLGRFGMSLFGDIFFFVLPFITYLLSFFFLLLLCHRFRFNLWLFFVLFLTV